MVNNINGELVTDEIKKVFEDNKSNSDGTGEKYLEAQNIGIVYDEVEEMNTNNGETPGITVVPVNNVTPIKEKNIIDVLDNYDIKDSEALEMVKIIDDYRHGKTSNLYSSLPKRIQRMCDNLAYHDMAIAKSTGSNITLIAAKNLAAKTLIESFINDADMAEAVDEYQTEMGTTVKDMSEQMDSMIGSAFDNIFNKLDEYRETNPELADNIILIQKAFEDSITYSAQLEFAKKTSAKKINKLLDRYNDNVYYFNKRINGNSFGINVEDISNLDSVLKYALPKYTDKDIKAFIITLCNTIGDPNNLYDVARVYRSINNISKYRYIKIDASGETIFENISKVIDELMS